MMFAEQWECRACRWQNGFIRTKCRQCDAERYHPDDDIDAGGAEEIRLAKAWDEAHGIKPETRTDTL